MIRNIVFDLSDTLLKFSPPAVFLSVTPGAGMNLSDFKAWKAWDQGQCTEEEMMAEILSQTDPALKETLTDFFDSWFRCYTVTDGMEETVRQLKAAGFRLYVLSDFPDRFGEVLAAFPFFSEFDGAVASYQLGMRKDTPAMFTAFLQKEQLAANECLFVDNWLPNVENAKTAGLYGIHFTDVPSLKKELAEKYNIK